jgi:hypothetical protein
MLFSNRAMAGPRPAIFILWRPTNKSGPGNRCATPHHPPLRIPAATGARRSIIASATCPNPPPAALCSRRSTSPGNTASPISRRVRSLARGRTPRQRRNARSGNFRASQQTFASPPRRLRHPPGHPPPRPPEPARGCPPGCPLVPALPPPAPRSKPPASSTHRARKAPPMRRKILGCLCNHMKHNNL